MSRQELKEFLCAIKRVHADNAGTPEKARRFLNAQGFVDKNGNIVKKYAPIISKQKKTA